MRHFLIIAGLAISLLAGVATADSGKAVKQGSIKGNVVDAQTLAPLPGATILITGTQLGASADANGCYTIPELSVGSYTLQFRSVGYEPLSRTDVIIRSQRITYLDAKLRVSAVEMEGIVVTAGYFNESEEQPTSSTSFSGEEIRRAPGSAGDVSRIVMVLPSIAKVNDRLNSLVVRGGSPSENGFYIDNIEIPNINHYPLEGSSGGPIGLLNNDFISDVQFSAGGFSAAYGDRLSSIMNISFRDGNREEFDAQLDLHMAGFGVTTEGPFSEKGSWMLSVRRSFLDLLVDAIGTGVAPRYSDYQGKLVYDLTPTNQLTTLGVVGVDRITFDKEQSVEKGNVLYGDYKGSEYAAGLNWRRLWSSSAYSNTSVSALGTSYDMIRNETKSDLRLIRQTTTTSSLQFRNDNHLRLSPAQQLQFGFEGKHLGDHYDYELSEYTNALGDTIPSTTVDNKLSENKAGAFATYTLKPFARLATTIGLRYDYFTMSKRGHVSPRLAFNLAVTPRLNIKGATGIYRQFLPVSLLVQREEFAELADLLAYHYVLGFDYLLSEDTKLTVEGYHKKYENFPLDPAQPQFFVVDELAFARMTGNMEELNSDGEADATGIELTVQKKLVRGIYGLVSGSYSRTRYKDLNGVWHDRLFDNRFTMSVEGGYKPNNSWEFSTRWIYAGGHPYTPLDLDASAAINRSVLDRDRVNEVRNPDYHSLNLRADRRFYFGGSSLIVYLSIWNAYGRKNVSMYYWNEIEQKEDVMYQWSFLPVIGMEYEF